MWFVAVVISGWLPESLANAYVYFLNSARLALSMSGQCSRLEAEGRCRFGDISLCGWSCGTRRNKFLYFRNGLLGNFSHTFSDYLTQKRSVATFIVVDSITVLLLFIWKFWFVVSYICVSPLSPATFEFSNLFSLNLDVTCRPLL
jgi:hypothetical protein